MSATYHFITHWELDASCEAVYQTLENAPNLCRWWPSVYLNVTELQKGAPGGVGKIIDLYTKGWLPYTLRWQFKVLSSDFPHGYALEAKGDFVGRGIWSFKPLPDGRCEATYDWEIEAAKPLLKLLTPLLRPIFSANHLWAMKKGEESLRLELRRRAAKSAEELAAIPMPPLPTWPHRSEAMVQYKLKIAPIPKN
jgi:hypothetical protein